MDQEAAGQIVDRLKAEGDLIRNSGTNSIRSVKIQLDRFEDIFRVIADNIVAQTEMMMKSLDIQSGELQLAKDSARREETAKQLEDLEEKQDQTELKKAEKETDGKEDREGKGLFAMLGGLGKLLMTGALIGGGLFVAYNLAKGFVDEMTGGGWTNFEKGISSMFSDIDWQKLADDLKSIVESIAGLAEFLANFNFSDILNTIGFGAFAIAAMKYMPGPLKIPALAIGALYFGSRAANSDSGPFGFGTKSPDEREENVRRLAEEREGAGSFQEDFGIIPQEDFPQTVDPIEESRQRLNSLTEVRGRIIADARENAAISSIPFEDSDEVAITERIDRDIAKARENFIRRLSERHDELDRELAAAEESGDNSTQEFEELRNEFMNIGRQLYNLGVQGSVDERFVGDQSSLNTPFEVLPARIQGNSASDVAESLLAHLVDASGISRISSAADRVAIASNGGSPVVIVNAPTTNNNVSAPSTSVGPQTSVVQIAGGGGSSINPYGIITSAMG